jgi:nucleoid DNA-binding protein
MKKSALVDSVSDNESIPDDIAKKDVATVIEATFEQIMAAIKEDDRVALPGFGTFNKKERAARIGRNPRTGEPLQIAASTTVTFKPGKELKAFMAASNEED